MHTVKPIRKYVITTNSNSYCTSRYVLYQSSSRQGRQKESQDYLKTEWMGSLPLFRTMSSMDGLRGE